MWSVKASSGSKRYMHGALFDGVCFLCLKMMCVVSYSDLVPTVPLVLKGTVGTVCFKPESPIWTWFPWYWCIYYIYTSLPWQWTGYQWGIFTLYA